MPKPSEIMAISAALMNDAAQDEYTNAALLPYFNLSLQVLQETYEQNDLPVTEATSAEIYIPAGIFQVGYSTTPALPADLIEIQQLWESPSGQAAWTPVIKQKYLPHYLNNDTLITQFLIWAWQSNAIHVIPANADNDLKLDYIKSMFINVTSALLNVNLPFVNIKTYLEFKTAAFAALFMGENESRAVALNAEAVDALSRSLSIPVKNQQSIITRRRPFRASYKRRGANF